jgi:Ca-activated chloride channel family protein
MSRRFTYSRWRPDSWTDEQRLESLRSLFSYLVVKTSGDVTEALEWLREIARRHGIFDEGLSLNDLIDRLKELGLIEEVNGVPTLTTRGVQQLRHDALRQIFHHLKKGPAGEHETPQTGEGVDRLNETRSWNFGDLPTNLDLTSTLTNAFRRGGIEDFSLQEEDLRVFETEHTASCATVVLVDISHSMILYGEDRITPAKQVALALAELIRTRFPKDYLACAVFGDDARIVSLAELPFLTVGPFHTNTRAGLQLARQLLRKRGNVNKQIFMITDGKPSAIFDDVGRIYKNPYGLDPRIVNKTLDEAVQCRREKVTVSTFMIARDPMLVDFVEEFTKANQGRAYFSSLDSLGEFIFVDYLKNRRRRSAPR